MRSSSLSGLFLFLVFINLVYSTTSQSLFFPHPSCSRTVGNFSTNSAYQSQLDSIFSSITSTNSISYGFFNGSIASTNQNSDTPHVIGLCRGDLQTEACQTCLNTSAYDLRQLCPNQKEAIVYNDNCTLRYSNSSILSKVVTIPDYMLRNGNNVSNPDSFNQALGSLLVSLRSKAASSGSVRKFAEGNTTAGNFGTIYAFVQCTPDLSEQQCSDCLVDIVSRIDQCCSGELGGRIMSPSCSFRFESSRFLDPVEPLPSTPPATSPDRTSLLPPPPTATASPGSNGNTTRTIILIVVPITVVAMLIIFIIIFLKRKRKPLPMVETMEEIDSVEFVQFDLATIEAATHGFSDDNKLGQGGFGPVYKGKLSNGEEIAVKRLSRNSGQGALEFTNEVKLLARLQHRNLVRLQGFCLDGTEKLLIYEFVPNSSLDHFIFDPIKRQLLNWNTRYKIIIGIARGLLYLHEDSRLRIIHRDLKASNILLDSEMNPKISDFGMAKLFTVDQTQADTSRIVGTYGYMAPEYAMHGNFSLKSDVFSFGVMVLEIVSGQRNNCFRQGEFAQDLLSSAWRNWREGSLTNVIDPTLDSGSRAEMARCIHISLLCVQENVADRPTMASVVLMLNSYSTTLAIPSQPAFFMNSNVESDMSSTQEYTSKESDMHQLKNQRGNISKNDVSITELYPR